jgi:uncharacterized protein YecE (DUF72 family)
MAGASAEPRDRAQAYVGTSGFSYRDWKGAFYPEWMPSRDWFHYYATRFNAVEINLTFYRSPSATMLRRWTESMPPNFVFVLKANQTITHRKRLIGCEDDLAAMLREYAPLERRLACVLFQLPPSLRPDLHQLDAFLEAANQAVRGAAVAPRLALEFRGASWNTYETFDCILRHGATMVLHDMPGAGGWSIQSERIEAGRLSFSFDAFLARPLPLLYMRFHGTSGKYAGSYGRARLESWAALAARMLEHGIDVHAYFNNTMAGAAVEDALTMSEMLRSQVVAQ